MVPLDVLSRPMPTHIIPRVDKFIIIFLMVYTNNDYSCGPQNQNTNCESLTFLSVSRHGFDYFAISVKRLGVSFRNYGDATEIAEAPGVKSEHTKRI